MKTIPLTKGLVALVDDSDFDFLNQWKWQASCCGGQFYAKREVMVNWVKRKIYMHRLLAGAAPGQCVDHKDRCTLNNQRNNLRIATKSENATNSKVSMRNTSGFTGVDWLDNKKKWRARLVKHGKRVALGHWDTIEQAVEARKNGERRLFGEFSPQ